MLICIQNQQPDSVVSTLEIINHLVISIILLWLGLRRVFLIPVYVHLTDLRLHSLWLAVELKSLIHLSLTLPRFGGYCRQGCGSQEAGFIYLNCGHPSHATLSVLVSHFTIAMHALITRTNIQPCVSPLH